MPSWCFVLRVVERCLKVRISVEFDLCTCSGAFGAGPSNENPASFPGSTHLAPRPADIPLAKPDSLGGQGSGHIDS